MKSPAAPLTFDLPASLIAKIETIRAEIRREQANLTRYIEERDQVWAPHILAIPKAPDPDPPEDADP